MPQGGAAGEDSVHLSGLEQEQANKSSQPGPLVIHEVVRDEGLAELDRSFNGLAWSGLAAGLSIGFSFLMQAAIQAGLPDAPWRRLVAGFGYSLGFLIVVLGRQQLFTETTLTAVIPVLTERTPRMLGRMLRVWGIVLAANLVGTAALGALLAQPGSMPAAMVTAMDDIAGHTMPSSFGHGVLMAAFAGWLIGLMVWMLPGAGPSRPLIIILLTYAIAACGFPHVVAGSVEAAYSVAAGHASIGAYFGRFLAPTLAGNCIGGTLLAALLNHAPIAGELDGAGEEERRRG